MLIVDAHEDIAYNALGYHRQYLKSVKETRLAEGDAPWVQEDGPALLGWPEWIEGRVAVIFATLFATPERRRKHHWEPKAYRDLDQAFDLYKQQVAFYHRWEDQHPDCFRILRTRSDLQDVIHSWQEQQEGHPLIGLLLLMEGADPIRTPDALEEWVADGVRMIGPAWTATRYAGGTHEPGPLTRDGRELLEAMQAWNLILDLSHMTDPGVMQALDQYEGAVVASHCNARALVQNSPTPERHLSDQAIRTLAERDGVVGVVPFNPFLEGGWKPAHGRHLVTLDHVYAQIDHMCQLIGDAAHVGIGSDFDGGMGVSKIPMGLDSVADLRLIGDVLTAHGYPEDAVKAIMGENWINLLRCALPES